MSETTATVRKALLGRVLLLLDAPPSWRRVYQNGENAEYAPPGTQEWVAKAQQVFREMLEGES